MSDLFGEGVWRVEKPSHYYNPIVISTFEPPESRFQPPVQASYERRYDYQDTCSPNCVQAGKDGIENHVASANYADISHRHSITVGLFQGSRQLLKSLSSR